MERTDESINQSTTIQQTADSRPHTQTQHTTHQKHLFRRILGVFLSQLYENMWTSYVDRSGPMEMLTRNAIRYLANENYIYHILYVLYGLGMLAGSVSLLDTLP